MRKYSFTIIFLTLIICLTGCAHASERIALTDVAADSPSSFTEVQESVESATTALSVEKTVAEPASIVVYVCGAVKNPGVYELLDTARINDAVNAAGGFSDEADETYVNLAAPLSDGVKLKIPTLEETMVSIKETETSGAAPQALPESYDKEPALDGENASEQEGGLININTASVEELKSIPGIGEKTAGRIVEYRDKNGKFGKIEDIMKISGIKDKLFSKIKDKITV